MLLSEICTVARAANQGEIKMTTLYDFEIANLQGKPLDLSAYKDKVVLVVNTASKCGLTPQYEGLQALYEKYKDQGLVILFLK